MIGAVGLVVSGFVSAAPLSAEDAVALALERSGAVEAAAISAQQADLEVKARLRAPELRLEHKALDHFVSPRPKDNDGNAFEFYDETEIALGWRPPALPDLLDGDAVDARAQAALAEIEAQKRDLAAEVRRLHARVLSWRKELALASGALVVAQRLERSTTERVRAEAATSLDARLAALGHLDAAADLQYIEGELARDEARLASLVGKTAPLDLAEGPSRCVAPAEDAVLFAEARARSDQLSILGAELRAARAESAVAWSAWVPWLTGILAGYTSEGYDKSNGVGLRIEIGLPVFQPLSPRTRSKELEVMRLEALVRDEEARLHNDVAAARARLAGTAKLHELYIEGMKNVVEGAVAEVEAALEAGETDILRVAEIQARALRARRGLIRAHQRCEEAAIDLARMMGQ